MSSGRVLGSKPSEWAAIAASDASSLSSPQSAAAVRRVLSTAGSRGPQKALAAVVQPHVAAMAATDGGSAMLEALVRFGTKVTVGEVLPAALSPLNPASLSESQAALVDAANARLGCSDEGDAATSQITQRLFKAPEVPHFCLAVPAAIARDDAPLAKAAVRAALFSGPPTARFIAATLAAAAPIGRTDEVCAALWKAAAAAKALQPAVVLAVVKGGHCGATLAADYVLTQKKVADAAWASVVAAVLREAPVEVADRVAQQAVKAGAKPDAAVAAALFARFPTESARLPPAASAAAIQWSRAHESGTARTRSAIASRVAASKRARADADDF